MDREVRIAKHPPYGNFATLVPFEAKVSSKKKFSVRYVVHGYFAKTHGWVIRGLEPSLAASTTVRAGTCAAGFGSTSGAGCSMDTAREGGRDM